MNLYVKDVINYLNKITIKITFTKEKNICEFIKKILDRDLLHWKSYIPTFKMIKHLTILWQNL
jgi:hypothetical protein